MEPVWIFKLGLSFLMQSISRKSISFLMLDQCQYLGNCPPTPPLTQQQSIDNNLGLMLG